MQCVFPTSNDCCYLPQVLKGQGRNSTGIANMSLNILCSHLLHKSRLNVKL